MLNREPFPWFPSISPQLRGKLGTFRVGILEPGRGWTSAGACPCAGSWSTLSWCLFLRQGPEHPNPGKPFTARGFPRQCYLPDNAQGRKVSATMRPGGEQGPDHTAGGQTPHCAFYYCSGGQRLRPGSVSAALFWGPAVGTGRAAWTSQSLEGGGGAIAFQHPAGWGQELLSQRRDWGLC